MIAGKELILPAAVQEALPEQLQIEALVCSATEPRVAAVGVELLAEGGQGLRDGSQGLPSPLPRAAAVREALALFKVRLLDASELLPFLSEPLHGPCMCLLQHFWSGPAGRYFFTACTLQNCPADRVPVSCR